MTHARESGHVPHASHRQIDPPERLPTSIMSKLQAIRYERGKLELLDQRLLPLQSTYIPVRTPQEAFDAIRSMVVRGAPAIGCTAALAVAAWLVDRGAGSQYDSAAAAADDVQATTDHLVQRCAAHAAVARRPLVNMLRGGGVQVKLGCCRVLHACVMQTHA